MTGINDSNSTDTYDNSLVGIMGGTDNTRIGNVNDRLKVDSQVTFTSGQVVSWSKYLKYYDMNASSGGVARETLIATTFTNLFSYTGSGLFIGFRLTMEDKNNFLIRLIIDGEDVFIGSTGIDLTDVSGKNLYGWEWADVADDASIGMDANDETFSFTSPLSYPIGFSSSAVIQAKHRSGSKKFRAGLVALQRII